MGQLYSKLNQLVLNDVETAADPNRPREKLETAFNTPARPFSFRLPDPRSPTQIVDRTPIYASGVSIPSGDTPKAPKSVIRPRYLETNLDEVIPDSTEELQASCVDDVVEVILEEGNDTLEVNWSGTGGPDRTIGDPVELSATSLALDNETEINAIVQDWIKDQKIPVEEDTSVQKTLDPPDVTVCHEGKTGDLAEENRTQINSIVQEFILEQQMAALDQSRESTCHEQSDSLVVHNGSQSFDQQSGDLEWDDDSLLVSSPAITTDGENKNIYNTPKKTVMATNKSGRTPLGDVSTNSPIVQTSTPKFLSTLDNKHWKNVRHERLKRGIEVENTPPHAIFNSYPPEVVHSAPGRIRTKNNKTKWSNDSIII